MVYDLHSNTDNVILRDLLVGALSSMHKEVFWENDINGTGQDKQRVDVLFFHSITGDERWLKDMAMNDMSYDKDGCLAETAYMKTPYGIVKPGDFSIIESEITNKTVRTEYLKEEADGSLNTYSSDVFIVPFTMSLEIEIYVDSNLDQYKALQAVVNAFFKNIPFSVDTSNNIRIPAVLENPGDYNKERNIEFGFDEEKKWSLTFTTQLKSYMPIFIKGTEIFAGKRMGNIQSNLKNGVDKDADYRKNIIDFSSGKISNKDESWPNDPKSNFPPKE